MSVLNDQLVDAEDALRENDMTGLADAVRQARRFIFADDVPEGTPDDLPSGVFPTEVADGTSSNR
jgi:hypothetical protein